MKKTLSLVVLLLCILFIFNSFLSFAAENNNKLEQHDNTNGMSNKELAIEIAKIDKKHLNNLNDKNIAYQGKNVKIYSSELNCIKQKKMLTESDVNSELDAKNYLIKRETLYNTAITSGYNVSELEIKNYINIQIESFSTLPKDSVFFVYLNTLEMSNEEYWNSQYDVLKKELIINKYKSDLKNDFVDKNNIELFNNEKSGYIIKNEQVIIDGLKEEDVKEWETFFSDKVNNLIKSENIIEVQQKEIFVSTDFDKNIIEKILKL